MCHILRIGLSHPKYLKCFKPWGVTTYVWSTNKPLIKILLDLMFMDITHKSFEHVKYMRYNNFQSWYVFQSLTSVLSILVKSWHRNNLGWLISSINANNALGHLLELLLKVERVAGLLEISFIIGNFEELEHLKMWFCACYMNLVDW